MKAGTRKGASLRCLCLPSIPWSPRLKIAAQIQFGGGVCDGLDHGVTLPLERNRTMARSTPVARGYRDEVLSLDDGLDWPRGRDRICVAVEDLPLSVFQTENRRHPKRNRGYFIGSANLGPGPFNFDNVCQVRPGIPRDSLEVDGLALPQLRNRLLHRLLNRAPASNWRAERIGQ